MFRATKANKSKEAKKKEAAAPKSLAKKRSSILADSSDDELQVLWIQQLLFNTNSLKVSKL